MKPYPLALLNHFTVPFIRSTNAPSGTCSIAEAVPFQLGQLCCYRRVLSRDWIIEKPLSVRLWTFLCLAKPEHTTNGLAIPYGAIHNHANGAGKRHHSNPDDLVRLRLGLART